MNTYNGPAQAPSRCTKRNSLPIINGQCTKFICYSMWHYNYLCTKASLTLVRILFPQYGVPGHAVLVDQQVNRNRIAFSDIV